ncbi:MAG TPA: histidinol dehydrogenase [Longimicrobiaceae bacterium]|nr:histidinol dehydrogenase [Longimicrobiaceae bacterium]
MRRIAELNGADLTALLVRGRAQDGEVERSVAEILEEVRVGGDGALRALASRLDGVELESLEVPRALWSEALEGLEPELRRALEEAAGAIGRFHEAQRPRPLEVEAAPGLRLGRRPDPLQRVGVYAPGGRAAYPSSVLMGVVPARVAGVGEIVVCSPPGADGLPAPLVMAACAVAGADRLFALGGAGAVAAMAYGTRSVPAVDRVVGPGNAYVAEAKRQLTAVVSIDSPAGPSELLIVADETADPRTIALEMLAQAEHDPDAAVVLVSTSREVAGRAGAELAERTTKEPRAAIVEASLATAGALLLADSLDEALSFARRYAPEHLLLLTRDSERVLERVRCAGTVFLGAYSSVAFGDYATGANHVLPTGGRARSYSGLSTDDFVRWTTWQRVEPSAAPRLAAVAAPLAEAEGLPAHAAAARAAAGVALSAGSTETSPPPTPRAPYLALERYDPVRPPLALDLSANTNLWGPCPPALAALGAEGEAGSAYGVYPTPYATALKGALAECRGVDPTQVVTGCGSDDLIDSAIRAFCEPGGVVAFPSPTFPMAEVFARMNDARPRPVPVGPGGELGREALDALCDADVVYLCRPNNPTGAQPARADVARVLERARGLVLLDEAYGEYAGESLLDEVLASGRGVVLRTLSKAYGLAGLRVGYALGPAPLIRAIELSRGPYKVGAAAERAAVAAVREGGAWVREIVERTVRNRERLADALGERGLRTFPSAANFVLATGRRESGWAVQLRAELAERGVGVRAFESLPGIGDAIRVTAGPWEQMERFLAALDEALVEAADGVEVMR